MSHVCAHQHQASRLSQDASLLSTAPTCPKTMSASVVGRDKSAAASSQDVTAQTTAYMTAQTMVHLSSQENASWDSGIASSISDIGQMLGSAGSPTSARTISRRQLSGFLAAAQLMLPPVGASGACSATAAGSFGGASASLFRRMSGTMGCGAVPTGTSASALDNAHGLSGTFIPIFRNATSNTGLIGGRCSSSLGAATADGAQQPKCINGEVPDKTDAAMPALGPQQGSKQVKGGSRLAGCTPRLTIPATEGSKVADDLRPCVSWAPAAPARAGRNMTVSFALGDDYDPIESGSDIDDDSPNTANVEASRAGATGGAAVARGLTSSKSAGSLLALLAAASTATRASATIGDGGSGNSVVRGGCGGGSGGSKLVGRKCPENLKTTAGPANA